MMLTEIEKQINLIEDVRELRAIQGFIKDRKNALGSRLKYTLSVGERVAINSSKGTEHGVVAKINRTRAVIDIEDSGRWTVPFSMISKMGDSNG